MMDIIQNLLSEKRDELVEPLVQRAGFSGQEARSFLPPAFEQISQALGGGGLDLGSLLGNRDASALMEQVDVSAAAQEAGVEPQKAESGFQAILPLVLSFVQEKAGGAGGLGALLGGGDSGGTASALGGLASKLFKR